MRTKMKKIKHEVKVLTYHEMGVKLDDQLEAAKLEYSSLDGSKKAFAFGKSKVEELTAHIDKDTRDGTLDVEQSTLAKRWVLRAVAVLQNLGVQSEVQSYQAQGKIIALEKSVGIVKTLHDNEKALLDSVVALEKAVADGTVEVEDLRRPVARSVGDHPGDPLADRREETASVPEVEQAIEEAESTQKKRRKSKV
jgi:hypothetical protein